MRVAFATFLGGLCLLGGCISQHSVNVEPIQLEPIQVTMDVNVRVQNESAGGEVDEADVVDEPEEAEAVTEGTPQTNE